MLGLSLGSQVAQSCPASHGRMVTPFLNTQGAEGQAFLAGGAVPTGLKDSHPPRTPNMLL